MTHQELIEKAREQMRALDWRSSFGAPPDVYDQARVVDTALIYFDSQKREDYIEVVLNSETGELISTVYHPRRGT
jgi:hypothetical protein